MDLRELQSTVLEVAQARALDSVLDGIVQGLARDKDAALVRIWLVRPGDQCASCPLREECEQDIDCLHLVASAGRSQAEPGVTWDNVDGRYRRFPVNVRKVGRVAGSGEPLLLRFAPGEADWPVEPSWMKAESIRCFAGQPLVFRGEVLGVMAVFYRGEISEETFGWLRTFADQAAVAIANARAFEEVECLREQLELERDYLREEFDVARTHMGLVGESPALLQIERQVEMVAPTDASVLVQGESGTGKELIASAIHDRSPRANKPIVRVNCASIPHELFESEFFGHAKGAFTGALSERAGRFQVADGGTLFLDEVGEIPLDLQGKLLRVLQEGQFSRVGEDTVRSADVRVIAATNRDLKKEAAEGRFREDLYYRLSVFPLEVPPLRERREDIGLLAAHFLAQVTSRRNMAPVTLRKRDIATLSAYRWPGNVRELQNVIERAAILATGGRLQLDLEPEAGARPSDPAGGDGSGPAEVLTDAEVRGLERRNLLAALESAGWKISGAGGAAELLDIKPTTLASRMKKMQIRRPRD